MVKGVTCNRLPGQETDRGGRVAPVMTAGRTAAALMAVLFVFGP